MSLAELFNEVLAKPGMYVGRRSIARIKSFIDGYGYTLVNSGKYDQSDPYYGFQPFVQERLRITTSHGWDDIVSFMPADEVGAFELTRELWNEYRGQASPES